MLIFDRFPNQAKAQEFAKAIGRKTWFCETQEEAHDVKPLFKLIPPIVLVERSDELAAEVRLVRLAECFGGRFAGT